MIISKLKALDSIFVLENNGHLDFYLRNTKIKPQLKKVNQSIFNRIKFLLYPIKLLFVQENNKLFKDIWLISQTINNKKSLLSVYDNSKTYVHPKLDFTFRYLIFYKLFYIVPVFLYLLYRKKLKWFYKYYELIGISEEFRRILKKKTPKIIVFTNDHLPYHVALKKAANKLHIPTYYIQHACAAKNMPPLDFTVSFLDGQDSYDKYKSIGIIKGKVELVGAIRFNKSNIFFNKKAKVEIIGFALNAYDDIEDAIKLIKLITIEFPKIHIIIRMHPGDKRKIKYSSNNVYFSNSKEENILKFLNKIDLLIAGDSSIHLEAAMCNVVSVYYKISKTEAFDIYEFVKNKLVFYAKDLASLIKYIRNQVIEKENILDRVGYYDEYFRTKVNYKEILKKYKLL